MVKHPSSCTNHTEKDNNMSKHKATRQPIPWRYWYTYAKHKTYTHLQAVTRALKALQSNNNQTTTEKVIRK